MIDPVSASRTARHAYWRAHTKNGNRPDVDHAADLAYNQAIINGPPSWRTAYPLRTTSGSTALADQLHDGLLRCTGWDQAT
jgi:hypothetical protein